MKRAAKKETESDIVRAICDYLALRRHFFWRQNTAPLFREGRFFSMPKYAMKGVPDVIMIDDTGHFVGIECKTKKGKLSPDQLAFQALCKKNGAEYLIMRSVDDAIEYGL